MENVPGPLHPTQPSRPHIDKKEAKHFSPDVRDLPKIAKEADLNRVQKEDIRKRLPDMRVILAWLKGIYRKEI